MIGILPIKLVAPVTEWKEYLARNVWHVRIAPDTVNGLAKVSAVDVLQLRGVDAQRFVRRLGNVTPDIMQAILIAIAAITEMNVATGKGVM